MCTGRATQEAAVTLSSDTYSGRCELCGWWLPFLSSEQRVCLRTPAQWPRSYNAAVMQNCIMSIVRLL